MCVVSSQNMMAVGSAVVALSDALAVGESVGESKEEEIDTDNDGEDEEEEEESEEEDDEEEEDDVDRRGRQKKRVKFKKGKELTEEYKEKNIWRTGKFHDIVIVSLQLQSTAHVGKEETAQDMINAYQQECLVNRVKPIQILLDQLKVTDTLYLLSSLLSVYPLFISSSFPIVAPLMMISSSPPFLSIQLYVHVQVFCTIHEHQ